MNVAAGKPRNLESYVHGEWVTGAGDGTVLLDAATGAPIAITDTTGVDFAASLAHARDKGGPVLRAMTFHQRALILKALAAKLMEHKEEFYALSAATGATAMKASVPLSSASFTRRSISEDRRLYLILVNVRASSAGASVTG